MFRVLDVRTSDYRTVTKCWVAFVILGTFMWVESCSDVSVGCDGGRRGSQTRYMFSHFLPLLERCKGSLPVPFFIIHDERRISVPRVGMPGAGSVGYCLACVPECFPAGMSPISGAGIITQSATALRGFLSYCHSSSFFPFYKGLSPSFLPSPPLSLITNIPHPFFLSPLPAFCNG